MFFYIQSCKSTCCDTNKKIQNFQFYDQEFFDSPETSGVGQVMANKQLV